MSTRFYPRFVKGNPQLRIFLPDWIMIMLKPTERQPKNLVTFKTDPRMTDWDIKNYLEKIYNVQVIGIRSRIVGGDLHRSSKGLGKKEDFRIAQVTLPPSQAFEWPDLFPQTKVKEEISDYEKTLEELRKSRTVDQNQTGVPSWFAS
uniref:Large ribosomal subunit protein uL23m n=1 Tax=Aceria tosichella TaxID=561515 RepID=A0A6G1SPA0_9ACAR